MTLGEFFIIATIKSYDKNGNNSTHIDNIDVESNPLPNINNKGPFLYSWQLFGNFVSLHLHTRAYTNNGENALIY